MQPTKQTDGAGLWDSRLIIFPTLPSTNQWVLDNSDDCRHGDIVLAQSQTAGRGRFGRDWLSSSAGSLTLSAVLHPGPTHEPILPSVCQAAAVAVRATVAAHGIDATLKWPNDVLVAGRKTAGILAETAATGTVALGIGLNVNIGRDILSGLSLSRPATSMSLEAATQFDMTAVRALLIEELRTALDLAGSDPTALLTQWQQHDGMTGRQIEIGTAKGPVTGQYSGLDSDGRLLLTGDDGVTRTFLSGDVSVTG